jgi:hypothetical protein
VWRKNAADDPFLPIGVKAQAVPQDASNASSRRWRGPSQTHTTQHTQQSHLVTLDHLVNQFLNRHIDGLACSARSVTQV